MCRQNPQQCGVDGIRRFQRGRVRILPEWEIGEPYTGAVHFVYTPGRHVALKIRAFIDYFVAQAR